MARSRAQSIASSIPDGASRATRRPAALPRSRPGKRLILCEDGSWLNSDSSSLKGSLDIPSNVTRMSRAIRPVSADGIPQIVYYHWGVGGSGGIAGKIVGIGGGGLAEIVREGYHFLATNWLPGDEIFIFGFSRGAYTARSIAGLIGEIGLLTARGLPYLPEIFRDVQHQHDPNYHPRNPDEPFPNKPSARDPDYLRQLRQMGFTNTSVQIRIVGVWDTVGALGIPKIGWLTRLGLQSNTMRELSFYDTSLSNCIEHAFQALALDERRFAFQPTLWEKLDNDRTVLRQVWFPGAHSNIGGGYDDQQIATITLAWMISQCGDMLDINYDYLDREWDDVDEYYEKTGQRLSFRRWSFGKIFDGLEGIYSLGGSKIRTPGRYTMYDGNTGKLTDIPLENTCEYVHASVRTRFKQHGPGLEDRGEYENRSLQGWKLVIEQPPEGHTHPRVFYRARNPIDGFHNTLPEAPLWGAELRLLQHENDLREYITRPKGVASRRRRRRSAMPDRSSSRHASGPYVDDR